MEDKLKNYCTIYIIRHGETEWNVKKIIQGHKDSRLTKNGKSQAIQALKRLKHIKFDAIFSSDLGRAKQTAEILNLERKLAITTTKALRERHMRKYEGQNIVKLRTTLKEIFKKFDKLSDKEKFKFEFPDNIESIGKTITRFITYLREIAVAYPGKTILIVTHGGNIRTLLIHLGFGTYDQLPPYSIGNLANIKLLCDGVDFFIKETHGINKLKK